MTITSPARSHGLHGLQAVLFGFEDARRPAVLQPLQARDFQQRAVRREVALEHHHAAGRSDCIAHGADHSPSGVRRAVQFLGKGAAGEGDAVAVQVAAVEQRLEDDRRAARVVHVLGQEPAARLQVGDQRECAPAPATRRPA
jgi:hypothetical protein